ncbi:polyketide cyclase [Streptomyces cinnamoneus]|uniref:Polyketide cyclase n=1 Tax=Streptomyces cinnamoneus TaxID=53446 RepID=A0A2G1XKL2_STRCJ|nr:SRPBCC family protein [Streptomyces cinnamoneus]PHQ51778.1 polyketide cyclase [Streptomyces cinnamoneus]PPT12025.1 SRPBCC family protein [Streptomyces cinnamoneus]
MRYADGPSVHEEVHIDAAPGRVWHLVTDIGLPARLSPELQRTGWLDGATAPEPGARFEGYNRHPLVGEWRTISRVVELEPERRFCWEVTDPDGRYGGDPDEPLATWMFELKPEGDGVLLRQSVRVGPGRSGASLAIDRAPEKEEAIVEMRLGELRTGIQATLRGVREIAEAGE